jgi:hypothetical protein
LTNVACPYKGCGPNGSLLTDLTSAGLIHEITFPFGEVIALL